MRFLNLIKSNWSIFLFLVLNFLIHKEWVISTHYLTYSDTQIYLPYKTEDLLGDSKSVFNTQGLGGLDLTISNKPLTFFHGIFNEIGIDYIDSFKIIYFIPILLIGPLGMYFFFNKTLKFSQITIFSLLFLFFYNSYFVILQTGHLMIAASLSFSGLLLYFFHEYLRNYQAKHIYLLIILMFLMSFYDLRILLVLFLIIFIILIFLYLHKEYRKKYNFKKILVDFLFICLFLFLLNFYWINTYINSEALFSNSILDRSVFGNQFFSLIFSLTLSHSFWNGKEFIPFSVQAPGILSYIVTLSALLSFIYVKRNQTEDKYSYFFVLILGILITKQSDIPFSGLYSFLFENIPGFKLFREASKFYIMLMIGFSVVIGFFLEYLKEKKYTKMYFIFIFLILLNFSGTAKSILTKDIKEMFIQREVPREYQNLNSYIDINKEKFERVLWLPAKSRWGYETNNKPGLEYTNQDSFKDLIGYQPEKLIFSNLLNQEEIENYLNILSIKYVVVTKIDQSFEDEDYFAKYYSGFKSFRGSKNLRDSFISQLNKVASLNLVDLGSSELTFYENKNKTSLFYELNDKKLIPISFDNISNTQKEFNLSLDDTNKVIIFSTNYDTNWKFYINKINENKSKFENSCQISKDSISVASYNLIELNFSKEELLKLPQNCFEIDNDLKFKVTAYYRPQNYFNTGILVSLFSGIILVILVIKSNLIIRK